MKQITWITGKGGVGKTLHGLAHAYMLSQKGHKVFYINTEGQYDRGILHKLNIPYLELGPDDSIERYIAMKLNSKLLAKGIVATPFFKSIFNIVPAMAHLVFLGHIVHMAQDQPDLHLVLDLPASGHALTLIQSTFQFQRIFKSGIIFQDIENIHDFLYQQDNLHIEVLTLPSEMAIEEGYELIDGLKTLGINKAILSLNNLLSSQDYKIEQLPSMIQKKIEQENALVLEQKQNIDKSYPLIPIHATEELIKELAQLRIEREV